MKKKLIVNTVAVSKLAEEFLPRDVSKVGYVRKQAMYSTLMEFLDCSMLSTCCSDDCIYDVLASAIEIGYTAAQAGCDEVTLVTADEEDSYIHWVMKGSSEKLLRDFSQYMSSRKQ